MKHTWNWLLVILSFITLPAAAQSSPACTFSGRMLVYNREDQALVMRAVDAVNADVTVIDEQGSRAHWSPDGCTLAYVKDQTVHFWSEDQSRTLNGQYPDIGGLDWSPDSQFITFDAYAEGLSHIFIASADGQAVRQLTTYGADPNPPNPPGNSPVWSPRGDQIAYIAHDLDQSSGALLSIMVIEVASGAARELAPSAPAAVTWSPDGQFITFIGANDMTELQRLNIDSGEISTLFVSEDNLSAPQWSSDGTHLVFDQYLTDSYLGGVIIIRIMAANADSANRAFLGQNPVWSPDGNSLAYYTITRDSDTGRARCELTVMDGTQEPRLLDRCRVGSLAWHPSALN